ncbi:MAG: response regulator [Candidatus Coproplasma sp.]
MRIIAVDDEKLALEVLVSSIEKIVPDCEIHGFRKPDEAIDYVCKNGCDVAFLDIKMRGMTGLELARRIKDVSGGVNIVFVTGYSEYTLDAFRLYASDYLLKPVTPEAVQQALEHLRCPLKPKQKSRIWVQCFGNFEVFADGKPIVFKRSKAKEIFAYLVDRRGATVTMGDLMTVIWEEGPDTLSRRSNLRNLIHEMKRALVEVGGEEIIVKGRNTISLNCNAVDCDYFDFLNQIPYAVNAYHGEYMLQYSWAEITTGSITK